MNKIYTFFAIFLSSSFLFAEPKMLECIDDVTAAAELERLKNLDMEDAASMCVTSDFSRKYIFKFDTRGLQNPSESLAEKTFIYACGIPENTTSVKMTHTPTVISFAYTSTTLGKTYNHSFNVDRKTLRAGSSTMRDYSCTIKDIDTSENLI